MTAPAPSPDQVLDLLAELRTDSWPTGEAEREAWFDRHGLTPDQEVSAYGHGPSQAHVGRSERGFPSDRLGWHLFEGELVGVSWFLWGDQPRSVDGAAARLVAGITEQVGEPADSSDDPGQGGTARWVAGAYTIDLYRHAERRLGPGRVVPASVQLHLDLTERSDATEAWARANPTPPPPGFPRTLPSSEGPE